MTAALAGDLPPEDLLILALDAGQPIARAAITAGLRSEPAIREARANGWPTDMDRVRAAAAEIRARYETTPGVPAPMATTRPASRRRGAAPVPIEDDVAAALTTRPAAPAPVLVDEPEGQPQPAVEATGIPADLDREDDRRDELEHAAERRLADALADVVEAGFKAVTATAPPTDQLGSVIRPGPDPREIPEAHAVPLPEVTATTDPTTSLTIALLTLRNGDGEEHVLAEAVVDIKVDRRALLDQLDGDLDGPPAVTWAIRRRVTPAARQARAALAVLLEEEVAW